MSNLLKSFEQYCCVIGRNVIVEEITYENGTKGYRCTMLSKCEECKNKILKNRLEKN